MTRDLRDPFVDPALEMHTRLLFYYGTELLQVQPLSRRREREREREKKERLFNEITRD